MRSDSLEGYDPSATQRPTICHGLARTRDLLNSLSRSLIVIHHTLSGGREHMWLTHGSRSGDCSHFSLHISELSVQATLRGRNQRGSHKDTTKESASFFGRKTTRGDTIVNR